MMPRWNRALPLGTRVGLLGVALLVLLAACGEHPADRLLQVGQGGPRIDAVEPSVLHPGGGEQVTLRGQGFAPGQVVWVGDSRMDEVQVTPDGDRLTFTAPRARPGAALDVGVGEVDPQGEPTRRSVLGGGYRTSGLSGVEVALLGVGIALAALLGTPLFIVIAATTCLGLYLETQLKPDLGFFVSGDSAGAGATLFVSWLAPMGDSPLFIAIPLFTFAGTLLSESKAPTRLITLCRALLGWFPGGLALVTLATCCFFTAFTGASGVTIIALGGLLFPILLRERYPERFSLGLLTTGGSLGLLLPPALPVIVYGLVARVDVGRLFVAALVPMIILVVFLGVTSVVVALVTRVPRHTFVPAELFHALRAAVWELPLPLIVVGGIYKGYVTAAEASAVTAVYVIVSTVVIYRDVQPRALVGVVRRTAVLVGAILLIMGTALGFTDWLTLEEIPQKILGAMQAHIDDRLTFLVMLNLFLLVVGCLMDIFSATLVVVPLIAPVALEFGVDPYHLAVIFLVNLEIGYSTPPVGINLFIASLRFRRPVFTLYRASVLFLVVLLLALMLITYVPALSLGLFDGLPALELRGADGARAPARLEVEAGSRLELSVVGSLGGVTLEQAKASRAEAMQVLRDVEQRLGKQYDALDEEVRAAQAALTEAQVAGGETGALRERLAAALEARAPLEPEAQQLDVARRLVDEVQTLERKVRWRSRLDGTERSGDRFALRLLEPGVHVLTATAEDRRRHVVQESITVVVTAPPGGEAPGGATPAPGEQPGEGGDEDWGEWGGEGQGATPGGGDDDGSWGDDSTWGDSGGDGK